MFHLVFVSHEGRALGAESEEKHEPVSDIDTVVVDSLKALDLNGRLEKSGHRFSTLRADFVAKLFAALPTRNYRI